MKQKFIKLGDCRLLLSTVKKYISSGSKDIVVYYTHSRDTIDNEIFKFDTTTERNEKMDELHRHLFEDGFINLKGLNIKLSMIKKYKVYNERLYIYYTASRNKPRIETFEFDNNRDLANKLLELDIFFKVVNT